MALKKDYRVKELSYPLVSIVLHVVDHRFSNGDECMSLKEATENVAVLIENAMAEILEIGADMCDDTEGVEYSKLVWVVVNRTSELDVYYIYVFSNQLEMKQYLSTLGNDFHIKGPHETSLDKLDNIPRQLQQMIS